MGAYITNISDIDLMDDQFSIELLLWTVWHGELDQNPSDQLRVLNGIYNGDIQRFERIRRDQTNGHSWSLYKVRSPVVKRWRLQRDPQPAAAGLDPEGSDGLRLQHQPDE